MNKVEGYITVIGISISLLAYIHLIGTYMYFEKLRTHQNYTIVSLCAALLLSEIIILAQNAVNNNASLCTAFAVLLHHFLLVSYLWVAIIGISIAIRFKTQRPYNRETESKLFHRASIVAWSMPAFLVLVLLLLDKTGTPIGYGKYFDACWITYKTARIAAYIVPVYTILLGVFVILVWLLHKIRHQSQQSAAVLGRGGISLSQLVRMTLQLIVVLGLVEIFGLVQGHSDDDKTFAVFRLLYTLFRSFRGALIWLFYVPLQRQVVTELKNTCTYKLITSRSQSSPRTEATTTSTNDHSAESML